MKFEIKLTPIARDDLEFLKIYEQKRIVAGIKKHLQFEADLASHRRKRLRPNEASPWELKLDKYRVFYGAEGGIVKVIAVGYKEHNQLFIRGQRVEL